MVGSYLGCLLHWVSVLWSSSSNILKIETEVPPMHSARMQYTGKMVLHQSSCKKTGAQCFKVTKVRAFRVMNNIKKYIYRQKEKHSKEKWKPILCSGPRQMPQESWRYCCTRGRYQRHFKSYDENKQIGQKSSLKLLSEESCLKAWLVMAPFLTSWIKWWKTPSALCRHAPEKHLQPRHISMAQNTQTIVQHSNSNYAIL